MTTTFFSLQEGRDSSGWNIVQKSFPSISGQSIRLSITVTIASERYEDKTTAKIAAEKMAELYNLPFISENISVITIIPFSGCFLPIELTPTGGVIGQGTNSPNLDFAISEAQERAVSKQLPFIIPNFVRMCLNNSDQRDLERKE